MSKYYALTETELTKYVLFDFNNSGILESMIDNSVTLSPSQAAFWLEKYTRDDFQSFLLGENKSHLASLAITKEQFWQDCQQAQRQQIKFERPFWDVLSQGWIFILNDQKNQLASLNKAFSYLLENFAINYLKHFSKLTDNLKLQWNNFLKIVHLHNIQQQYLSVDDINKYQFNNIKNDFELGFQLTMQFLKRNKQVLNSIKELSLEQILYPKKWNELAKSYKELNMGYKQAKIDFIKAHNFGNI